MMPKVGVGVIILKDGKVLMQKRINAHGHGTWSFPGGHLEFNEEFAECAQRETKEELGIKIKNLHFAAVTNDKFTAEEKHYITVYMLADYDSGEIKIMEPEKIEEWKWCEWHKLPTPLFLPIENLLKQNFRPIQNKSS